MSTCKYKTDVSLHLRALARGSGDCPETGSTFYRRRTTTTIPKFKVENIVVDTFYHTR